jgi:hypothetical protein
MMLSLSQQKIQCNEHSLELARLVKFSNLKKAQERLPSAPLLCGPGERSFFDWVVLHP